MPGNWLALYKQIILFTVSQTSHIFYISGEEKIKVELEFFCDKMLYMTEARQHDTRWKLLAKNVYSTKNMSKQGKNNKVLSNKMLLHVHPKCHTRFYHVAIRYEVLKRLVFQGSVVISIVD